MTVRVYEFSKTSGLSSKELVKLLQEHNFDVSSHMSVLTDKAIAFLEKHIAAEKAGKSSVASAQAEKKKAEPAKKPVTEKATVQPEEKPVESKPVAPEVKAPVQPVQAPAKPSPVTTTPPKPEQKSVQTTSSSYAKSAMQKHAPLEPEPLVVTSMTVGDFAEKSKKPLVDVIIYLMKKGIIAARNQVVSEEIVADLAKHYELKTVESKTPASEKTTTDRFQTVAGEKQAERLPVVVVIGHVDHGKTTLLDYIRKTRVAAREKGGITQHLGAYEAHTQFGDIVFLDTPGHEAFSLMRVRGIKVADIAILVVAADDGIMPQTIEAIRAAQQNNITIIIALNKIDKVNAQQIDKVKHSLSQYNLTPEEWGGQTVVMPISAKLGQGVDSLLEVVCLQAQLMELAANPEVTARGFVLESKVEKGLGFVATVICQQGTLRVGDFFTAGNVQGKVNVMVDSTGARVKEALPSVPVLVAGFDQLPQVGAPFEVVTLEEYKKARQMQSAAAGKFRGISAAINEQALSLIIKADNVSSLEAVLGAIEKLSGKAFKNFNVVHAAIGPISESDVLLAADTQALIYGLHVKMQSNINTVAQKHDVTIKLFDIIYKMLEDLEVVAEQGKPVKMITKKTGEAVVLKVFDIKGLGVIAGSQVKSGVCSHKGKVIVFRGKYKVGEGQIKGLQREKKAVKEVHAGFECGFLIEGFNDFQVDDRIECYLETPENA